MLIMLLLFSPKDDPLTSNYNKLVHKRSFKITKY